MGARRFTRHPFGRACARSDLSVQRHRRFQHNERLFFANIVKKNLIDRIAFFAQHILLNNDAVLP